jgi:NTP pyrophosphatase (non-canonical NTP hydrolase)
MIGFVYDVGELGRLLMAAEGRWVAAEDREKQLEDKMAECLWWLFTLSGRLGIDLSEAFRAKMEGLEKDLEESLGKKV